ncbi:hypothetical protein B4V02_20985 [Paenibacillus kribbensis]|uniref:Uncharacterized protein n=1 Tax=Paenibacillus kribbensis TaxID=172713 RepID=A0A222WTE5_9BACL|nr:hypothetical protein [Paenibacillus kribbensis]ASR48993.1 hypothetical protein B4V02_20985 [Paenibacillus kribbensis]
MIQYKKMEEILNKIGYDFKGKINDLGQVKRSERRKLGEVFALDEHVKGMILVMLSNQRL